MYVCIQKMLAVESVWYLKIQKEKKIEKKERKKKNDLCKLMHEC